MFIKETLGCQCPDEVFQNVEVEENRRLNIDIRLRYRINVGNRLLVYVVEVNDESFVHARLLELIFFGRDEKEQKKFNTFRLVLASPEVEGVRGIAESMFSDLDKVMDLGDSIHLHVVSPGEIDWQ
ncbi:MAG: hypothetical protein JXA20_12600 [Spirochaetes bacterium]|nr:hypothetical protein [Spirochaetota bacterium]